MGRDAAGVRGMKLEEGDEIVGAGVAAPGCQLLTVTEHGYGKRTDVTEYMRQDGCVRRPPSRGGKGLKNQPITAKTGCVAGVCVVQEDDDVMMIEDGGVIIRMPASDINRYRREAQGVILMRLGEENRVIGVQCVEREEEAAPEPGAQA